MGVQVPEGHLMPDHVHMLISIPPKYSVAEVIGYREKLDLDQTERGDDPRPHQKSGDSRQGVGSVAIEARVLTKSHLSSQIHL
jgi:hypothetical protein